MESSLNPSTGNVPRPEGAMATIKRAFAGITVEPGVFLSTFGFGVWLIILQNLMIDKVCQVNLGQTEDVCSHLDEHKEVQVEVQKEVAYLAMFTMLISSLPGVFLCLLVGPWSDSNGRKPLLVLPMLGMLSTQIILFVLTYLENSRAEWILLSGIFGGGYTIFTTGVFTYIADITRLDNRTSRIAVVDFCILLGFPLGTLVSGRLFKYFHGFYGVFGTTAVLYAINSVFFAFFIRETRGSRAEAEFRGLTEEVPAEVRERALLNWQNAAEVFRTCFKRRQGWLRGVIICLIFLMMINFTCFSTAQLMYLYTRLKFSWNEQEYTIWSSIGTLCTTLGSITFVPLLSSKLKIHDALIGIVGAISGIVGNFILAFAIKPWMLYLGSLVGVLSACSAIVIRSMLSKVGPKSDLGKIYSLVSCFESTVPVVSIPILTVIYNSTLHYFPGAIFVVQAGIYAFIGSMLCILYFILTRSEINYNEIIEDNQSDSAGEGEENAEIAFMPDNDDIMQESS